MLPSRHELRHETQVFDLSNQTGWGRSSARCFGRNRVGSPTCRISPESSDFSQFTIEANECISDLMLGIKSQFCILHDVLAHLSALVLCVELETRLVRRGTFQADKFEVRVDPVPIFKLQSGILPRKRTSFAAFFQPKTLSHDFCARKGVH